MWLYAINLITIPIYARLIKDRKKFILVVAIQLFLILAFASVSMGVDSANYVNGYEYIKNKDFDGLMSSLRITGVSSLKWPYYYENGYTIFNWVSSHIGLTYHIFLAICAAINISAVSYFIYRYSKKPWLSFVLYCSLGFFMSDFGIVRQSLAISMMLFSYCFLDKKKYILGILFFFLAVSFHRVALITIPLVLLFIFYKRTITKKTFAILLSCMVPLLLLSGPIYENVVTAIMKAMNKGYAGHGLELNKRFFLYTGISCATLFGYDFSKIKRRVDSVACFALIMALACIIFGLYNDFLSRALKFYSIFLLILIPSIFDQYRGRKYVLLAEGAVFILLLGYMLSVISGTSLDPYVVQPGLLWF